SRRMTVPTGSSRSLLQQILPVAPLRTLGTPGLIPQARAQRQRILRADPLPVTTATGERRQHRRRCLGIRDRIGCPDARAHMHEVDLSGGRVVVVDPRTAQPTQAQRSVGLTCPDEGTVIGPGEALQPRGGALAVVLVR